MKRDPDARLTEVEMLLTHQQRELAELNAVAIDQQRQIDALKAELARISGRLTIVARSSAAEPLPNDDDTEAN